MLYPLDLYKIYKTNAEWSSIATTLPHPLPLQSCIHPPLAFHVDPTSMIAHEKQKLLHLHTFIERQSRNMTH